MERTYSGSGSNGDGAISGLWVGVATDIGQLDVLDWAVPVVWSPLADVLSVGVGLAVGNELVEAVVGESWSSRREEGKNGGGELHLEDLLTDCCRVVN